MGHKSTEKGEVHEKNLVILTIYQYYYLKKKFRKQLQIREMSLKKGKAIKEQWFDNEFF